MPSILRKVATLHPENNPVFDDDEIMLYNKHYVIDVTSGVYTLVNTATGKVELSISSQAAFIHLLKQFAKDIEAMRKQPEPVGAIDE